MKPILISLVCAFVVSTSRANTAPTPAIVSAAMRPGTTFMDVVFRVDDPDDATVKVRALAFVDGVRSFAKVIRPVTFVEGTASKIGDAIPSNTNHTLTWDVGADWGIDLGQVKFEILARDGRGLLAFDWITIPAAGGNPALTISKDAPSDAAVLDALFWQYADGDSGLTLTNGLLKGNSSSGTFKGIVLADGATPQPYGPPFVFKRMNLDPASAAEVNYAKVTARIGLLSELRWHPVNRPYAGISTIVTWGSQTTVAAGLTNITAISAGAPNLALLSGGYVAGFGDQQSLVPSGMEGIIAISAGGWHGLALKNDNTVVAWGNNESGQASVPAGLNDVVAISAGNKHNLALKNNGTVVAWGSNEFGESTVPPNLSGVTAIAAAGGGSSQLSVALKADGTVVTWGSAGGVQPPPGITNISAIAAGHTHILALKNDGTVVAWGSEYGGETVVPPGLSGVVAIAAGPIVSMALKSDGTVVTWGYQNTGNNIDISPPAELSGVTAIAVFSGGVPYFLALRPKAL